MFTNLSYDTAKNQEDNFSSKKSELVNQKASDKVWKGKAQGLSLIT